MDKEFVIKEEIDINAPKEKVWQVLTEAEYYRQWDQLPDDFKGDKLKEGTVIEWKGYSKFTVTRCEKNERLEMSLELAKVDLDPSDYDISYSFSLSSNEDQTKLNIEIGDFTPIPDSQKYIKETAQFARKAKHKIQELAEESFPLTGD